MNVDAIKSGAIGLVIGLVATYLVSLIFPTTNLRWSLVAVGFASFFGALGGYSAGAKRRG